VCLSARYDIRIWFRLTKTRCGSRAMASLLIIADSILIGSEILWGFGLSMYSVSNSLKQL